MYPNLEYGPSCILCLGCAVCGIEPFPLIIVGVSLDVIWLVPPL
jgi:hypothetical protein